MSKTVTIYAVISSKGSYDDYCEWIEKCFTSMDAAAEYARTIDASHVYESSIPDKVFDDVEDHWYEDVYDPAITKFCIDNGIPTQEEMSDVPEWMCSRTEEQNRMVCEFADKIEKQYDEWCIKYLTEHYPEYTEQDYWDYLDAVDHAWDEWHDCKIKELELVIDDNFEA